MERIVEDSGEPGAWVKQDIGLWVSGVLYASIDI